MDRRTAQALDDHITGRFNPSAPFNQPDDPPPFKCGACGWEGDELTTIKVTERSEFWGQFATTTGDLDVCPQCGSDNVGPGEPEREPDGIDEHDLDEDLDLEDEDEDFDDEDEDEEDEVDEHDLDDDEEDPL